ncbi:unnamed protein product [Hymenolepis diminuta]|uniref:Uncharacterized protein n=1 Tax=Hymenolepis diminuta TaxID=6216 RepID=A0A564YUP7_HYMDI|nr:unnamed protein product [Hymenolepis diminuta]
MPLIRLCRSCFSRTCSCADSNVCEKACPVDSQSSLSLLSSSIDSGFDDNGFNMRLYLRKHRNALIPYESSLRNDDDPKIREAVEYFYGPINDKRQRNVSNCSSDASYFSFPSQDSEYQSESESPICLGPPFRSSTQNNSHSLSSDNNNFKISW